MSIILELPNFPNKPSTVIQFLSYKVEFLFINRHMLCLYFAIKKDPFANLTLSRVIPVEEKVGALFSIKTLTTIGWLPVLAPLVPPPAQTRFQMSSPRLPTILTGLEKTLDWGIWVVHQKHLDLEEYLKDR